MPDTQPPRISVVIPTRNRRAILARTLRAWHELQGRTPAHEIIIVDDGSDDGSGELRASLSWASPAPLRWYRVPARGPAAARNVGIRAATAPIILFAGDDVVPHPEFLAEHARSHARFPDAAVGVLGFVTWSSEITVTPYMEWLERSGMQFAYGAIRGAEDVDPRLYFYTANLSLKREFLLATGEFFDESFPYAAFEDLELGWRLSRRGLRLKFNPAARGAHLHPTSVQSSLSRLRRCGESSVLFSDRTTPHGDGVARQKGCSLGILRNMASCLAQTIVNAPYSVLARAIERRTIAPRIYSGASQYAIHRGLLHYHWARLRGFGDTSA